MPPGSNVSAADADGPTRIPTPTRPIATPAIATRGRRSPKKTRPSTATHSGIIAISRAAIPDGTVCSPRATRPMPPAMSAAPMIVMSRNSRRVGNGIRPRRRMRATPRMTSPASPNLVPGEEERRDRLDRDPDPEVRRAPDDVEDRDPDPDQARPRRRRERWHSRMVQSTASVADPPNGADRDATPRRRRRRARPTRRRRQPRADGTRGMPGSRPPPMRRPSGTAPGGRA